jgi:hypothetical protein
MDEKMLTEKKKEKKEVGMQKTVYLPTYLPTYRPSVKVGEGIDRSRSPCTD